MMISGMKISVAQNISDRVRWLETLSHTVRLERGSEIDGMMNGNSATPAVPMMPAMAKAEATKVARGLRSTPRPMPKQCHIRFSIEQGQYLIST